MPDREEWRPLPGSEVFLISNLGHYTNSNRYVPTGETYPYHKTTIMPSGKHYAQVDCDGIKTNICLATAVCEVFNGPKPFARARVVFIDGDRNNCRADNLRWGTIKEYRASKG